MIFVTVGTTMPFDELLEEMDRLAADGSLGHEVVCQTGASTYAPAHCESFPFRPGIDDLMREADAVVTHGGSTVIQLLELGRPFVAVANPRGADNHQGEMLEVLGEQLGVLWTRDVRELGPLLHKAINGYRVEFTPPNFFGDLIEYLKA